MRLSFLDMAIIRRNIRKKLEMDRTNERDISQDETQELKPVQLAGPICEECKDCKSATRQIKLSLSGKALVCDDCFTKLGGDEDGK